MSTVKSGTPIPGLTRLADKREAVKLLLFGEPGSGKTTAMAKLANLGPIVYVDAEAGLKIKPLKANGINVDNISVHTDCTYDALDHLFWQLKADLARDPESWAGVVFDSLTEVQAKLMAEVVKAAVIKADNKGMERDPFATFQDDWGMGAEQLRRIVRSFRDLPCHIGFACLPKRDQDDDGVVTYRPALMPSIAAAVMGYVDIMGYCNVIHKEGEQERYVSLFRRQGKYLAKDRYGVLDRIGSPDFDKIIEAVEA